MAHGPVMLDLAGTQLDAEDSDLLQHPATGGVILFSRNYESPGQLRDLVSAIHAARTPPLLVGIDQEGGRVQRLREGFTRLPPSAWFGRRFAQNHEFGLAAAREAGWLMAAELRSVGIDFSFAPVLDIDRGFNSVIGDRAFAANPDTVAALAGEWMQGAREAGMPSVGKHFPGHGGVAADSHQELPEDDRDVDDLWYQDLIPFRHLIDNGLEAVMPAHVRFGAVDSQPAGFSRFWLRTVLRERLGFGGAIVSDDLSMGGAADVGDIGAKVELALAAGCDLLLVCNDRPAARQALRALLDYADPVAQSRLVRLHGNPHRSHHALREERRWHAAVKLLAASERERDQELALGDSNNLDPTDYSSGEG